MLTLADAVLKMYSYSRSTQAHTPSLSRQRIHTLPCLLLLFLLSLGLLLELNNARTHICHTYVVQQRDFSSSARTAETTRKANSQVRHFIQTAHNADTSLDSKLRSHTNSIRAPPDSVLVKNNRRSLLCRARVRGRLPSFSTVRCRRCLLVLPSAPPSCMYSSAKRTTYAPTKPFASI